MIEPLEAEGPSRPPRGQRVVRLDLLGARFLRDVQPGEVVTLTDGRDPTQADRGGRAPRLLRVRVHLLRPARTRAWAAGCSRFARADGRDPVARGAGRSRVVIPVPDSGNAAARGLARAAGLPQDDGFIKNRYVARTFIQPGQELRRQGLRLKFNPLPEVVAAGGWSSSTTRSSAATRPARSCRCSASRRRRSPPADLGAPIKHPCHYGIDMSTREEMIAHGRTVEEVCAELGADSLHYLSLAGGV